MKIEINEETMAKIRRVAALWDKALTPPDYLTLEEIEERARLASGIEWYVRWQVQNQDAVAKARADEGEK